MSSDSLFYEDGVKHITPRNRHYIFKNSLNASAGWSNDWELDLNPTKSEHLPIGSSHQFVTYTLPSHKPPNTQTIPKVSTTKGLGIVLNTRLAPSIPPHPIPRRGGIGNSAEARSGVRERASACPVRSSSPAASIILSYTSANKWRSNIHV